MKTALSSITISDKIKKGQSSENFTILHSTRHAIHIFTPSRERANE
jgi:hypothetical protein